MKYTKRYHDNYVNTHIGGISYSVTVYASNGHQSIYIEDVFLWTKESADKTKQNWR